MALSLAVGTGVTVWPYAFIDMRASNYTANFWRCEDCSEALKGLRNGIAIFLSTGYCIGTVVAILLNMILPQDAQVVKTGDRHFEHDGTEDVTSSTFHVSAAAKEGADPTKEVDSAEDSAEGGTSDDLDKTGDEAPGGYPAGKEVESDSEAEIAV
jgi:hypothetical protein